MADEKLLAAIRQIIREELTFRHPEVQVANTLPMRKTARQALDEAIARKQARKPRKAT